MHSGVRLPALILALTLLAFGCAKQPVPPPQPVPPRTPYPAPPDRALSPPPAVQPGPAAPAPIRPGSQDAAPAKPSPRATASLSLTEQGRQLLAGGQTDAAISTLERASSLNPSGGQNYYWLAQAWLVKGEPSQAAIYHRQARRYLSADPAWSARLDGQARALGLR
ncbi:MAG: hypothetical protein ACOZHQ_00975 [Thermodesulfobacteriota bacterium]